MSDTLDRLKTAVAERYTINREIGAGGMATVYLAEDLKHHRQVAIKVLRPELAAALGPDRFLREIEVAAQLHHPHILPLYDSGEVDGFLYYVMPYEEGDSLREKLAREGELPIGEAVRILRDVVDALSHAHKQGVVHRDIKPDNVMLSGRHALVTDFGVAKAVSEATGQDKITTAGMALGTPAYMAPEQASADPHVDHRADIYAIGALAYELLAGRPPFVGNTPQQVLAAHVTEEAEPVSKHRETVPAVLEQLVMRCLAKRPADRWQTAEELMPQLEALTTPSGGTTPTGMRPVPSVEYEAIARRAHPVRVALVFGVSAVALLALVFALVMLIGLPDWVFMAAVALVVLALPITLLTGHTERKRALSRTSAVISPPSGTGLHKWFRWRRTLTAGVFSFAALAAVVAAMMVLGRLGVGPVATLLTTGALDRGGTVILSDFTDQAGDSALATMFTEAFRTDLNQSTAVSVMPSNRLRESLARMERNPATPISVTIAQEVAVREDLKAVIAGEIHRAGAGYQFVVEVLSADSGNVLVTVRETADDSTEIISAIDRLSKSLRERIGESIRSVRASPRLSQATTASLPALRFYSQAVRASDQGDFFRAFQRAQEAVAIDTTFAEAYRMLAIELGNAGVMRSAQVEAMSRAFRHRHKLPDDIRYKVEGSYYSYVVYDPQRAIEAYGIAADINPRSSASINNAGVLLDEMRNQEVALSYFQRALAADSTEHTYHYNLVGSLLKLGMPDSAQAALERFEAILPGHPSTLMMRAGLEVDRKDWDSLTATLQELGRNEDLRWQIASLGGQGLVQSTRGNIVSAERFFSTLAAGAASARMYHTAFDMVVQTAEMKLVFLGDRDAAIETIESGLAQLPFETMDPLDRPYLTLAAFYAIAGLLERSQELVAEFDAVVPTEVRTLNILRDRDRALGLHALHSGRLDEAIEHMKSADVGHCIACPLTDLAQVYDAAGDADSAIALYERYINTHDAFRYQVDWLSLAPAYKRLGELYESRGDDDNAVEYYNEFVELWLNADPELQPQVAEVRRRIASLVGEPRRN